MVDNHKNCAVTQEGGNDTRTRKPYQSPNFQSFGKLSRTTQGSFGFGGDAGGTMTVGMGMGMGMGGGMGMGMGMGAGMGM
ncbi:MAG: hypothetical protein AB8B81_00110 [Halioglobus sp.]